MRKTIYILFCMFLVVGCSTTETSTNQKLTIRDSVRWIDVPVVERTLPVAINTDSLIAAWERRGRDTTTLIRYYPLQNKFDLRVKPDSVFVTTRDTLVQQMQQTIVRETSDTLYYACFFLIVVCVLLIYTLVRNAKQ